MKKVIEKIPVWAYTLILMGAAALASVFVSNVYAEYLVSFGFGSVLSPIFYAVALGALYGGLMRLALRIVYSIGDRIFFGVTKSVPDYNLRRLPITYNNFLRNVMFWLIVSRLIAALFMSLLTFLYPVGYYLWQFLSSVATLGCLVTAYLLMDKYYVPTWQSGKFYVSLLIPSAIVYAIALFL